MNQEEFIKSLRKDAKAEIEKLKKKYGKKAEGAYDYAIHKTL